MDENSLRWMRTLLVCEEEVRSDQRAPFRAGINLSMERPAAEATGQGEISSYVL